MSWLTNASVTVVRKPDGQVQRLWLPQGPLSLAGWLHDGQPWREISGAELQAAAHSAGAILATNFATTVPQAVDVSDARAGALDVARGAIWLGFSSFLQQLSLDSGQVMQSVNEASVAIVVSVDGRRVYAARDDGSIVEIECETSGFRNLVSLGARVVALTRTPAGLVALHAGQITGINVRTERSMTICAAPASGLCGIAADHRGHLTMVSVDQLWSCRSDASGMVREM
jgi:hypothetical protein